MLSETLCLSTAVVIRVIFSDNFQGNVKRRVKNAGVFYRSEEELKMSGPEEGRGMDTPE